MFISTLKKQDTYFNYINNNWLARSFPHNGWEFSSFGGCNMIAIEFVQDISNFKLVLQNKQNFNYSI
jgi:hypothetical protein